MPKTGRQLFIERIMSIVTNSDRSNKYKMVLYYKNDTFAGAMFLNHVPAILSMSNDRKFKYTGHLFRNIFIYEEI